MRHLCVILSYIAQYSLLLPPTSLPLISVEVWPLGYASLARLSPPFNLIRPWANDWRYYRQLISSKTLLTCTGRINKKKFLAFRSLACIISAASFISSPKSKECPRSDLNRQPKHFQCFALPIELPVPSSPFYPKINNPK